MLFKSVEALPTHSPIIVDSDCAAKDAPRESISSFINELHNETTCRYCVVRISLLPLLLVIL